jgi:hypothetical protein
MVNRPSNHEICKKIADALEFLRAGKTMMVVNRHIYADMAEMGVDTEDFPSLLIELLQEIQVADPVKCYKGKHPPDRSTDPEIYNLELFAYCWHSQRLNQRMYLKFGIRKEYYYHVDCHISRPHK